MLATPNVRIMGKIFLVESECNVYVAERDTYELASHHHARNPYTPSSSFQALGYCSSSESGSRTVQDQPLFRPQAPTLRTLTTLRATTKGEGGIENGALKTLFRGGREGEGIEGGEERDNGWKGKGEAGRAKREAYLTKP